MVPPPGRRRDRDRLSALPDAVLGHALSFLPTKEAGRAAALSRRWRHVFCNVHTVSFSEREGDRACDWDSFYFEAEERKSCSGELLDDVCNALLCRRRCAGHSVPLRALRLAFDDIDDWDWAHVDTWLAHALRHSSSCPELRLDLRFRLGHFCARRGLKPGRSVYELPRKLFSCLALRTLCLAHCELNLPSAAGAGAIDLPFLETLSLTGVYGDSGLLISRCPRLVDLTLEGNDGLRKVSVLDRRLRRLALRCCHKVKSVEIDASELTSFDYSGGLPMESLLSLHGLRHALSSCELDFCEARYGESEAIRFRRLLEKLSDARHLHLHHGSLESRFFVRIPSFPNLTRLVLQGPVRGRAATVGAVGRVLAQTPALEGLSLYMEEVGKEDPERHFAGRRRYVYHGGSDEEEGDDDAGSEGDEGPFVVMFPDDSGVESSFAATPCLRHRVKEINMVHYRGDEAQRMMARLLFGSALVLERMCVVLAKGTFGVQASMKEEIESWVVAVDAEQIFL